MKRGYLLALFFVLLALIIIVACKETSRQDAGCGDGKCKAEEKCTDCQSGCVTCSASFSFISWADTKGARSILSELSDQIIALNLNPAFTIYPGDLEDDGFTTSGTSLWRDAIDGKITGSDASNNIFDITFPVRGNHDSRDTSGWQSYFDLASHISRIGALNYNFMEGKEDLIYSFDYGNSHFVGLDVLGDVNKLTSDQITWLDKDLGYAENRGFTHAFIYFHGPIYCLDGHCSCTAATDKNCIPIIKRINKIFFPFHEVII
jgi:hypothetical protein